jgi:hypothetical protein
VGVLVAAAIAWHAAEAHYDNCLKSAEIRGAPGDPIDAALEGRSSATRLAEGCSRLPW